LRYIRVSGKYGNVIAETLIMSDTRVTSSLVSQSHLTRPPSLIEMMPLDTDTTTTLYQFNSLFPGQPG